MDEGYRTVRIGSLSKSFGSLRALRGVSLALRAGDILGLVGPNGAGKTTLFRIIAGAVQPDGDATPVAYGTGEAVDARDIGFAPEQPPVYPELTVRDQVRFAARLRGIPKRHEAGEVRTALDRAGLDGVEHRLIGHLSKGYRQRVGLAQALVGGPRLLLLDEPTSGMDPNQVEQFHDMLRTVAPGRFAIYSSHQIGGVTRVADRIAILHGGECRGVVDVSHLEEPWSPRPSAGGPPPDEPGRSSWFLSENGNRLYVQAPGGDGERLDVDRIFALATRT